MKKKLNTADQSAPILTSGSVDAELIFIEYLEDSNCHPFSGEAGLLLDKMIEAMGSKREAVFLMAALNAGQVAAELKKLKPKVVILMGAKITQVLLNQLPASVQVISTRHPEQLLKNPTDKKQVWEDLKRAKKLLNWI